MQAVFLLNNAYQPYYKWSFRAMRSLPRLSLLAELMEYLLTTDNGEPLARDKQEVIESTAADVIAEVRAQGLSDSASPDLETQAYAVERHVRNSGLRGLHILAGAAE